MTVSPTANDAGLQIGNSEVGAALLLAEEATVALDALHHVHLALEAEGRRLGRVPHGVRVHASGLVPRRPASCWRRRAGRGRRCWGRRGWWRRPRRWRRSGWRRRTTLAAGVRARGAGGAAVAAVAAARAAGPGEAGGAEALVVHALAAQADRVAFGAVAVAAGVGGAARATPGAGAAWQQRQQRQQLRLHQLDDRCSSFRRRRGGHTIMGHNVLARPATGAPYSANV